jgi:hypothetical protein
MKPRIQFVVLALFLVFACTARTDDTEKLVQLGNSLGRVTGAVQDALMQGRIYQGLSNEDILRIATDYDPTLLAPFDKDEYVLLVQLGERYASVLLCTAKNPRRGIMEDTACKGGPDRPLLEEQANPPCEHVVDLKEACGQK